MNIATENECLSYRVDCVAGFVNAEFDFIVLGTDFIRHIAGAIPEEDADVLPR